MAENIEDHQQAMNLHCWEDGPETKDGMSTTCMLPDKHEGPHEWTRDDEIRVKFAPEDSEP